MMSHKDLPPPPPVTKRKELGLVEQVRSYQLITPLYGGGVETGTADPITIVRGTEIRGQLRFWWRATRGGAFSGDLSKMKAAEDTIWGAAAKKGLRRNGEDEGDLKWQSSRFGGRLRQLCRSIDKVSPSK